MMPPDISPALAAFVPLPATLRQRKLVMNAIITLVMTVIAAALLGKGSWLIGSALVLAALISGFRFWRLLSVVHVRLHHGFLQSYDPHVGGVNSMSVDEVGNIQFRAGSDRNLVKLPDRYIVRSNRYERELEVFVLADEQKPKLEAFFKTHFPEQYQESVTPLPGFPPARE